MTRVAEFFQRTWPHPEFKAGYVLAAVLLWIAMAFADWRVLAAFLVLTAALAAHYRRRRPQAPDTDAEFEDWT